jgi:VWFA-related protein
MSATADGTRSASKITKITKHKWLFVIFVSLVIFVPARMPSAVLPSAVSPAFAQAQQPAQTPNGPVFRVGTHLVTVDAYPTQNGGQIVRGLKPDDFEIYEDGKPQKVETAELIDYGEQIADDDRSVHLSAREGLELAADSRYRVIVFVLDRQAFDRDTWLATRGPLIQYLRSTVEPRDLVGFVTTDDPWESMVLGRRLSSIEDEIANPEWLRTPYREDALVMAGCGMQGMLQRVHADTTFSLLEGLVRVLGQVREDHSSIVYISNGISRVPPDRRPDDQSMSLPRTSLVNGRIQRAGPDMHETFCRQERQRLKDIDFDRRFAELTRSARAANISFYPIGIWNPHPVLPAELVAQGFRWPERPPAPLVESMLTLAKETDGFAVPPLGDVGAGLKRIAADVGTHYLLGYYTNNTKWDGKIRSIRVRLKRTGTDIRARSEYRAPTADEITGLAAPAKAGGHIVAAPVAAALSVLSAVRPSAQFIAYGALAGRTMYVTIETPQIAVDVGRWKDGAGLDVIAETTAGEAVATAHGRLASNGRASLQLPLDGPARPSNLLIRAHSEGESVTERVQVGLDPSALVGDPLGFRSSARGLAIPAASFVFAHDEKLRLEWPVLGAVDRYEARLLDRYGLPLKFRIAVEDQPVLGARRLVANVAFASLAHGDYVVELVAASGDTREAHYLAVRVN